MRVGFPWWGLTFGLAFGHTFANSGDDGVPCTAPLSPAVIVPWVPFDLPAGDPYAPTAPSSANRAVCTLGFVSDKSATQTRICASLHQFDPSVRSGNLSVSFVYSAGGECFPAGRSKIAGFNGYGFQPLAAEFTVHGADFSNAGLSLARFFTEPSATTAGAGGMRWAGRAYVTHYPDRYYFCNYNGLLSDYDFARLDGDIPLSGSKINCISGSAATGPGWELCAFARPGTDYATVFLRKLSAAVGSEKVIVDISDISRVRAKRSLDSSLLNSCDDTFTANAVVTQETNPATMGWNVVIQQFEVSAAGKTGYIASNSVLLSWN